MTDAKPDDALEEMRDEIKLSRSCFYAKKGLQDRHHVGDLLRWIAAWEKERADFAETDAIGTRALNRLFAIRAAVAKVRNEAVRAYDDALMRHGPIYAQDHLRLIADALDAALGGGSDAGP